MPTYPGGKAKSGTYQFLINLMPPHAVYIEAFLGGAAVLRHKRPAALNVGIDLNRKALDSAALELTAGRTPLAIVRDVELTGGSSSATRGPAKTTPQPAGANASRGSIFTLECRITGQDKFDSAARTLAAIDMTTTLRYDVLDVEPPPNSRHLILGDPSPRRRRAAKKPSGSTAPPVLLVECDAIEYLRTYPFIGNELVYCDPPYLHSTRSNKHMYGPHEMTDRQHADLVETLKKLPCMVLLSGYSSVLYARELKNWNVAAFTNQTRRGPAAEWVWFNYPRPDQLHDYGHLGANNRERQDLRRQIERWKTRLKTMPTVKRQALLAAIAATESRSADSGGNAVRSGSTGGIADDAGTAGERADAVI